MGGGRVILLAVQAAARRTIVAWTLYDFANSAFAAVALSTVYPAYYANVVVGNTQGRGDFWWGAAVSTAMVIGALTSPPLGGVADHAGARWSFFVGFSVVSIVATALMATVGAGMVWWGWLLAVVGIVSYEAAFVYYNSYLPRIAPPEKIGRVSATGFAVGYAGSLVAFAAAYPFAAAHAYGGCFVAAAVLFAVFSVPSFVILPADARRPIPLATAAARGIGETLVTLREIARDPARAQMRRFLTAYLVYEDGVNTVVTFAGVFAAKTLGFSFTEIIALFMVVQVTALLGSAAWARPTDARGPRFVVGVNLVQWALVTVVSYFVVTKAQF
jgi:UMF1 family MFS transporter